MKYTFALVFTLTVLSTYSQIPTDSLFFHAPYNGSYDDTVQNVNGNGSGATFTFNRHSLDSNALYVDGSNDVVDYGMNINMRDIDDFTASIWIKPSAFNYSQPNGPRSGRYTICGNAAGGGGFRFFQYQKELHFTVASKVGTDNCFYELTNRNQTYWVHLVGTSENGKISLYANGEHVKTVSSPNSNRTLGNYNFEVGRGTLNDQVHWEGFVDDLRIYNTVLSAQEIEDLYESEKYLRYTCINTEYDTITTKLYDTLTTTIYDSITVSDTITTNVYDTITTTLYEYDTIAVEDTLNIYLTTGTQNQLQHEIQLYPNPAGSVLNIDLGNYSNIKNYNFTITNSLGQIVWSRLANASSFQLPVSDLKGTGLFMFNVYDGQANLVERKSLVIY